MSISLYEEKFADLVGAAHAAAFAFARHGLMAILGAVGAQPGDEIILPPLTCKVVPLALLALGLRPVYADISGETLNLDAAQVNAKISPKTRAVLFQHTYGSSLGVEAVAEVAKQKQIELVEDCAQRTPHRTDGQGPPLHGRAAIFSNNLRKPLPAGSGGLAVTNDAALAEQLVAQRDRLGRRGVFTELVLHAEAWIHRHFLRPSLYWTAYDLNRKLSSTHRVQPLEREIDLEINRLSVQVSPWQEREGIRWLDRIPEIVTHRLRACASYASSLDSVERIAVPRRRPDEPLYYFPILVPEKAALLKAARHKRIELISWPEDTLLYPVQRETDLIQYGYQPGSCPVAERVGARLVGLPTYWPTGAGQQEALSSLLKSFHGMMAPRSVEDREQG